MSFLRCDRERDLKCEKNKQTVVSQRVRNNLKDKLGVLIMLLPVLVFWRLDLDSSDKIADLTLDII